MEGDPESGKSQCLGQGIEEFRCFCSLFGVISYTFYILNIILNHFISFYIWFCSGLVFFLYSFLGFQELVLGKGPGARERQVLWMFGVDCRLVLSFLLYSLIPFDIF